MARMIGRIEVGATDGARDDHPRIRIRVRDAALAERVEKSIADRLGATLAEDPPLPVIPMVRVATLADVPGAANGIAFIPVTRRNARRLLALAEGLESSGAAGIQLVWNGKAREFEGPVFRVLEAWRGTTRGCPLVLAPNRRPAEALMRMIAHFRRA